MFCAGYKEGRIDSCGGDSGGPLLCKPKGGRWTIWGITSFGKGCGKKGYYGIYAKVPNYISWIRSTISVEWNNASKNATINLHSVNSCDHTFFSKRDNYFQILFIMNLSNKLSQNKLFFNDAIECLFLYFHCRILYCLELWYIATKGRPNWPNSLTQND